MKRTTYQVPEIRDENDNIIQQGAFGKNTALANSTNDGWIDYVANDLEALYDAQTAAGNAITTGTLTVTGKTTTGTLDAGDTTVTGTVKTSGLTVTGETSVPTANEGNSSKAIANTEFVAKSLASLVNGAPAQLNTLNELAKALGNDANFAATITAELAKKLNSNEAESTYATKTEAGVPYQIKRNTAYKVGDVLTSPSLPYYVLRCTVAGTSGAAEPNYTDVALGDEITDGTVTWVVDGYLPLSGGSITGDVDITGDLSVSGAIYSSDPASGENSGQVPTTAWVQKLLADALKKAKLDAHPVGSYYWSNDSTSPATLFGGTWEALPPGYTLIAQGSGTDEYGSFTYTAGQKYGERKHPLTTDELPHIHGTVSDIARQSVDQKISASGVFSAPAYVEGVSFGTNFTSNQGDGFVMDFGKDVPHENLSPCVAAYGWRRTA